jgi:hypothetical protein
MNTTVKIRRTKSLTGLKAYENVYHIRAKQDFKYWTKDVTIPENNKAKGRNNLIQIFIIFFKLILFKQNYT